MSKRILVLLIVAALLVAGCVGLPSFTALRGSGNPVTQTFDFSNFDKLGISQAFQTEVTASDSYSVEVTVDDNLVEHLRVEQRGDTVYIGLEPNNMLANARLRARVTMPALTSLDASGASTIAEDESTCVVFGMPKAAIEMNVIDKVLPLENIAEEIISMVR